MREHRIARALECLDLWQVAHALELDEPVEGRSLLLVDDLVVTGWTLTRAAVALRARGADAVLPLTLGVER